MQRKRRERIVRDTRTGELFIETSYRDWQERLEAWKADRTQPCPMPVGHRMFRYPAEYEAELIETRQDLSLKPLANSGSHGSI